MKIIYAFKDIFRNKGKIIIFNMQLIIFGIFTVICLSQIMSAVKFKNYVDNVNKYNITSFYKYYTNNQLSENEDLYNFFKNTLQENPRAYSSFIGEKLNDYPDYNVIVGLGKFGQIFDIYDENIIKEDDITVLAGADTVLECGDKINIGILNSKQLTVDKKIEQGKYYVLGDAYVCDFDNSIVVLATFDFISQHYPKFLYEQIITNFNLINPKDEDINTFVKSVEQTNSINLLPVNANEKVSVTYNNMMQYATFFVIFFLASICFCLLGIILNILSLINSNMADYSIQRIYGADIYDLYLRVLIYNMSIVTLPIFTLYISNKILELGLGITFAGIFLFYIAVLMIISIYPIIKIYKQDITYYIRRSL